MKRVVAAFLCCLFSTTTCPTLALQDVSPLSEKAAMVARLGYGANDRGLLIDNSRCYLAGLDRRITIRNNAAETGLVEKNRHKNNLLNPGVSNLSNPLVGDVCRKQATPFSGPVTANAAVSERAWIADFYCWRRPLSRLLSPIRPPHCVSSIPDGTVREIQSRPSLPNVARPDLLRPTWASLVASSTAPTS